MSILLSKDLLPSPKMTKKEKLKVMKARQSALSYATLTVLQQQGYQVSQSLKIPGAFGFHAKHNGKPILDWHQDLGGPMGRRSAQ